MRQISILLGTVLFALSGCAKPANPKTARDACRLDGGEYYWQEMISHDQEYSNPFVEPLADDPLWQAGVEEFGWAANRPLYPLSEACVEHLAGDVGVRWSDWGGGLSDISYFFDIQDTSTVDLTIVGLHLILMLYLGSIESEWERTGRPQQFTEDVERFIDDGLLSWDDNLSTAVYAWVTEKIQYTRKNDDDSRKAYSSRRKTLYLYPQPLSGYQSSGTAGYYEAITLVHEAAHAYSQHVFDCEHLKQTGKSCDETMEGAYGMQGWFAHRMWLAATPLRESNAEEVNRAEAEARRPVHPPGFEWGYGLAARQYLQSACLNIRDIEPVTYCLSSDVLDWAGVDISDRTDDILPH